MTKAQIWQDAATRLKDDKECIDKISPTTGAAGGAVFILAWNSRTDYSFTAVR